MIKLTTRLAAVLASFLLGSIGHATPLPEQFTAVYDLETSGITIGETKRTLSRVSNQSGSQYQFESITRPTGIARLLTDGQVVERSLWNYFQNKPRPEHYTFFNSGSKKNRNVRLDFDWSKHLVINNINGEPWSMPLEHGTSDKLLYQLRIMQDLPSTEASLRYPVADGGKLKHYELKIVGKERIRTKLGIFDTIRLQHTKGSRKTTLWCAEQLGYLPVRIQQQKNDDSPVVATLASVSGITPGNLAATR
jgi:Protein of unknown function (DUF3108)